MDSQRRKQILHDQGQCVSCDAPLLDEEIKAGNKLCGVCRATKAQRKAMKRSQQSPRDLASYYRERIEEEQAKRRRARLPEGGRGARDARHAKRIDRLHSLAYPEKSASQEPF